MRIMRKISNKEAKERVIFTEDLVKWSMKTKICVCGHKEKDHSIVGFRRCKKTSCGCWKFEVRK